MSVTSNAIESIRAMIRSGELSPGDRLPPEQELAERLGVSRGSLREAVRALSQINVLDVRRGDGTYVTSLAPSELLSGMVFAMELLQLQGLRRRGRGAAAVAPAGRRTRRTTSHERAAGAHARGGRAARKVERPRRDRAPPSPVRRIGVRRHRQRDPELDPARPPAARRERPPGVAELRPGAPRHRTRPSADAARRARAGRQRHGEGRSPPCRSTNAGRFIDNLRTGSPDPAVDDGPIDHAPNRTDRTG